MSALNDFYTYAREEDIDIYAYPIGFRIAASLRLGSQRATFFDFDQLPTLADTNWAAAHESGHHHTGAYHKADSPYQLVAQAEYRADRWAFEHYLSPAQFHRAFQAGCTQTWELAEWFDLPEPVIKKALHYWKECRGVPLEPSSR